MLIELEHMLDKLEFFWLEEVVGVKGELVEPFLGEAFSRYEIRQVSWKWRKREEQVLGDATDGVVLFGKCGRNGSDFLVNSFVLEDEEGWIGGWKWWKSVSRGSLLRDGWCRSKVDNGEDLD
jgi:hypothetical protein